VKKSKAQLIFFSLYQIKTNKLADLKIKS